MRIHTIVVLAFCIAAVGCGRSGGGSGHAAKHADTASGLSENIVWRAPESWEQTPPEVDGISALVSRMQDAHARPEAIAFAKKLTPMLGKGFVGWATRFREYGRVDLVNYASLPCRADIPCFDSYAFVNGTAEIAFVDFGIEASDKQLPAYQQFLNVHPYVFLRGVQEFKKEEPLTDGGQRFLFTEDLTECMACAPLALAEDAYDFSPKGKYLRRHLVAVLPMPKN